MSKTVKSTPQDRLLATARQLFLAQGIPQTGINTVTAKADIARMTLYNNFASKEELILAVFEKETELRRAAIENAQNASHEPLDKVRALFAVALEQASKAGFRGCAFVNLAIETAAPDSKLHHLARQHKDWIAQNIQDALGEGYCDDPKTLSQQIALLWDGGVVGAYIHQSDKPIHLAQSAAESLVKSSRR